MYQKTEQCLKQPFDSHKFRFLVFAGWRSSVVKAHGTAGKAHHRSAVLPDSNLNSPSNSELLPGMHTHLYSSSVLDPLLKTRIAFTLTHLWLQGYIMEYLHILSSWLTALEILNSAETPQHSNLLFLLLYPRGPQCYEVFLVSLPLKPSWTHGGSQEP